MLEELQQPQEDATKVYVDNKSAINWPRIQCFMKRASILILTKYHFIKVSISKKEVELEFVLPVVALIGYQELTQYTTFSFVISFEDFSSI